MRRWDFLILTLKRLRKRSELAFYWLDWAGVPDEEMGFSDSDIEEIAEEGRVGILLAGFGMRAGSGPRGLTPDIEEIAEEGRVGILLAGFGMRAGSGPRRLTSAEGGADSGGSGYLVRFELVKSSDSRWAKMVTDLLVKGGCTVVGSSTYNNLSPSAWVRRVAQSWAQVPTTI